MTVRPRSVIFDLFGDHLRCIDAEVGLSNLTQLLGAFDIAPSTVRVTLSRLRREGWFETRRDGRGTVYTLAPHMLDVLDEDRARIFAPPADTWVGTWTMVIYQMTESERNERTQLRKALAWHGFGPLTTSTWLAPGDRRKEMRAVIDGLTDEQVDVLSCTSEGLDHDRALAHRCWDLETLAREYAEFNDAYRPLLRRSTRLSGAAALVARTDLVVAYGHFPFRDPRLPSELLPEPWPGLEAYDTFRAAHGRLGAAARTYVSSVVGRAVPELPLP